MATFNLITEPWIPVRVGGELELYSLAQTLTKAGEIERLEDASPLIVVALHRMLLAVLYRALQGPDSPEEVREWFEDGFPKEALRAYLETWHARFDLFDKKRPFYQVADLDEAVFGKPIEPKAWTELAPEVRDGGQGASLFNHLNDVSEPIPAAEAFRQLLVRQTFALGGLSRTFDYSAKRSPSPNAIFLIPHGRNLLETLCYCLDPNNYTHYDLDVPFWERDAVYDVALLEKTQEEAVMGCVQAYTWMSRSVKLVPLETDDGVYVKDIYFASGLAPKFEIVQYYDPMVGSVMAASGKYKGEFVFSRFRAERRFWRDFHSLFAERGGNPPNVVNLAIGLASDSDREVSLGMYGLSNATQEAKIDFARQEHYLLPEAIVADRTEDVYATLESSLAQAEGLERALFAATRKLAERLLSHGGRSPDPTDVTNLVKTFPVANAYWTALDRSFGNLLRGLTANFQPSEVERVWARELLDASNRAWELARVAAGDDAFALRAVYAAEGILRAAQKEFRQTLQEAA